MVASGPALQVPTQILWYHGVRRPVKPTARTENQTTFWVSCFVLACAAMPIHRTPLHQAAADAVAAATGTSANDLKVDATPRPELGDLAVGCFAIAKAQTKNPVALAHEIAAGFQPSALLASATAAGAFVNFRADRAATFRWLVGAALERTLLPTTGTGQTICIDYGSPNIAKHLAYHHIRGTVIGHALAQIYRALGYRVVGINFLGDWGTTHGMLLAAYKLWGAPEPIDVTALNALYVKFREQMKLDPALEQQGRRWFKKLEDGDAEARALWQRFRDVSWAEFQTVYDLLGIVYDEVRGESAYEPDMPRVLAELTAEGLLTESEGAQVVELAGEKTPLLVRTKDGTTLYATRDIAAAEYRWKTFGFSRSLYVVDRGQALHFRQLFKLLLKRGFAWASRCQHVPYGLVRLGGKKTSTRLGNVVLLKDVFMMIIDEVKPMIVDKNPEMPAALVAETARQVGVGAVIFGNLLPQREKDLDFDLDKVLATDGDSGPYLQYIHARCAAIARARRGETIGAADVRRDRLRAAHARSRMGGRDAAARVSRRGRARRRCLRAARRVSLLARGRRRSFALVHGGQQRRGAARAVRGPGDAARAAGVGRGGAVGVGAGLGAARHRRAGSDLNAGWLRLRAQRRLRIELGGNLPAAAARHDVGGALERVRLGPPTGHLAAGEAAIGLEPEHAAIADEQDDVVGQDDRAAVAPAEIELADPAVDAIERLVGRAGRASGRHAHRAVGAAHDAHVHARASARPRAERDRERDDHDVDHRRADSAGHDERADHQRQRDEHGHDERGHQGAVRRPRDVLLERDDLVRHASKVLRAERGRRRSPHARDR